MKNCPLCGNSLTRDKRLQVDSCKNLDCTVRRNCFDDYDMLLLRRQIDVIREQAKAEAAPRWRKIDLEAMKACLPVGVRDKRASADVVSIINSEYVLNAGIGLNIDRAKENLLWLPLPKLEEMK